MEGEPYHKTCFKCARGGCLLTTASYASHNGILYCQNHFWQVFKETGSYSTCSSPRLGRTLPPTSPRPPRSHPRKKRHRSRSRKLPRCRRPKRPHAMHADAYMHYTSVGILAYLFSPVFWPPSCIRAKLPFVCLANDSKNLDKNGRMCPTRPLKFRLVVA